MAGYDARAWFEFGVAVAGAAAALSGLLFVAMSINIERIVAQPEVPSMAAASVWLFALPLLVGLFLLIPGQSTAALGVELLVTGLVSAGAFLDLHRPSHRASEEPTAAWLLARYLPSLAVAVLTTIGGATLLAGAGDGLYWIAPAVTLAFVTGLAGGVGAARRDPALSRVQRPRGSSRCDSRRRRCRHRARSIPAARRVGARGSRSRDRVHLAHRKGYAASPPVGRPGWVILL